MIPVKQLKELKFEFLVLLKEDSNQDVIAHEIAHAFLNHKMWCSVKDCDQEKEANPT